MDTPFSIHPVKLDHEIQERYGDRIYESTGPVTVRAVASYEGLYDNLAQPGESILVKGKLERVTETKTGQEYYRVLVGSPEGKGAEYIKLQDLEFSW